LKRVIILADAAEDIEAARDFYEAQEPGIGEYCVDSLLADIESLGLFSGIHPLHFEFHRVLASRFPFGIYYREVGKETQVFAVLDLRRAIQIGFVKN
jgi:plasmid stabilization system protein ParE